MDDVIVVGGGISGIQAALDLAAMGHRVSIVERDRTLGGKMKRLYRIAPSMLFSKDVLSMRINRLLSNDAIRIVTETEVKSIEGCPNDFRVRAISGGKEKVFDGRSVVLAMGLERVDPSLLPEFGHGHYKDVITSLDLEDMLRPDGITAGEVVRVSDGTVPETVVFIQCVGSRSEKRGVSYCSATCCLASIKNASAIKERHPRSDVYVLYIDIRTSGKGMEEMYKTARRLGVKFVRGQPSMVMEKKGKLMVMGENTLIRELYEIPADLVVLAVGMMPSHGTVELMRASGIEMTSEGLPDDSLMSSVQSSREGIFLAGTVESPMDVREAIIHADACAEKVDEFLRENR